jgi:molybdopterin-guanine dinucleotide biosynthesis protein A
MGAATTQLLATAPCDMPFLPGNWVERLFRSLQGAPLCVAYDGVRRQPLVALLRCELRGDLLAFLGAGGHAVREWQARHRYAIADFSDIPDAFWNVNRAEDLAAAEARLRPEQQAPTG